ncbi:MAG TPA: helix-turn-helix transcriptional regulator [Gemmatimonadaceae bacterium]|jgi:DNA-binding PadR family transcriptional regulator
MPGSPPVALLQGTLDVIVLKALSWGPMHGCGIARWIQQTTGDVLQVDEGSLYPALYRMENRGWVRAEWGTTQNSRRAKLRQSATVSGVATSASGAPTRSPTWRRNSAFISSRVSPRPSPRA